MTVATADDLRSVPLFQGMTDRALEALSELAEEVNFEAGEALAAEGEDGETFYLLLEGRAVVTRAGRQVRELSAGDFFGEISLADGRPRTATVTTAGRVRAAVIRRSSFLELMEQFPAVRLGIVMALTERIRSDERDVD